MNPVHTSISGPRGHYRRALALLAVALAAAVAAGTATALAWDRTQLPLAMIAVVYAMVTAVCAVERAADHLAAARP